MTAFIEKTQNSGAFELCGRMIREGDELVMFIDELGRFSIPVGSVTGTILGLGESGVSGPVPGVCQALC